MELLIKNLKWARGKKSTILTIIALVITYCLTKGYIDDPLALLLNSILVVLGFGANFATSRLIK